MGLEARRVEHPHTTTTNKSTEYRPKQKNKERRQKEGKQERVEE